MNACLLDAAFLMRWFNAELSEHMDLYVEPRYGTCVLVERYHCDIVTTSRVYSSTLDNRECLLPPNSWNSATLGWKVDIRATTHSMNGRNTYAFAAFDDFVAYVSTVYATRRTIPFLRYKEDLRVEYLTRLSDADGAPPAAKRYKREKVYISS